MSRVLYHATDAAEAILREGFRATPRGWVVIGGRSYRQRRGVYLADGFVGEECGSKGEQVFAVTAPDGVDLDRYLIEDRGLGFREWALPAGLVNRWPARLCTQVEVALLMVERALELERAN